MAIEVWWVDPRRSITTGGYLRYKYHDAEVDTDLNPPDVHNINYYIGWQCTRQWYLPGESHHYESWSLHSFVKFKLPTATSGVMQSAELYLMIGGAGKELDYFPTDLDVTISYRSALVPGVYPWSLFLTADAYDDNWVNTASISNAWSEYTNYINYGVHWLDPVTVTAGVQKALNEGWGYATFKISPSTLAPNNWNWDERPTSYDQSFWLGFYGADSMTWVPSPAGFPNQSCSGNPWLKITYSGGTTQYIPGEDVTDSGQGSDILSIAADSKARMAIAGTEAGGVWYCWSGGAQWVRVYETESDAVTAVWLDIMRNFQDYPLNAIAWFGTEMGELYKSEDSLSTWMLMHDFASPIREIMSPENSSSKVVVGCDSGIYVSVNAGQDWVMVLPTPSGFN